jgi:hypothetical protein
MPGLYLAVSGAYCANHPGASNCSPDNVGSEVIAILIVGLIILLAIFGLWWRHGDKESDGVLARLLLAMARLFGSGNRR